MNPSATMSGNGVRNSGRSARPLPQPRAAGPAWGCTGGVAENEKTWKTNKNDTFAFVLPYGILAAPGQDPPETKKIILLDFEISISLHPEEATSFSLSLFRYLFPKKDFFCSVHGVEH